MTMDHRIMRKIKAFIFSGLVFSGAIHAAPVNQADLSAKCAAVANSALTLSAVTQSTTAQDNNNILGAFYLFSMFSGRRLGEEEFLKRYKFHQEALVKQWKSDILTKGAFRATLEFDGRLIGLMKPCGAISKNFDSAQSSELKAIKKFVESDAGKHLAETLKAMLEPKSDDKHLTKPSDEKIPTQMAVKPERKPSQDLKLILVGNSSYDDFAKACIDSYDHFDNAVLIDCNEKAYEQGSYYLQLLTEKLRTQLSNRGDGPIWILQRRWERVVDSECQMQGEMIGSPMISSCKLEQINLRIHQLDRSSQDAIEFQKIDGITINAVKKEVDYLVQEIREKIQSSGESEKKFNAILDSWSGFIDDDCKLQKRLVSPDVYDTCYLEHMSLRVQQMRRYVDEQVPIEEQQLLQPTQ